jgi:dephospho-CoA kinase
MPIGTYRLSAVEYLPYDSESRRVVTWIAEVILRSDSHLQVEHIGSTAVPHCWGKGIIDLLVLYAPGGLDAARRALDRIGFQRQGGDDPFPESRPMRVGSVDYLGRLYRIHAHVIKAGCAEGRDLVRFRELLRHSVDLRRAYEAEKRAILARGVTRGTEYSNAKGEFIRRALAVDPTDSRAGGAALSPLRFAR